MVAALGNLEIRVGPAGQRQTRHGRLEEAPGLRRNVGDAATPRRHPANDRRDVPEAVQPDKRIDLGQALLELATVTLGKASGNDHPAAASPPAQGAGRQDGVNRFLACVADKRARVHEDDVGCFRLGRDREPVSQQHARHDL